MRIRCAANGEGALSGRRLRSGEAAICPLAVAAPENAHLKLRFSLSGAPLQAAARATEVANPVKPHLSPVLRLRFGLRASDSTAHSCSSARVLAKMVCFTTSIFSASIFDHPSKVMTLRGAI